MPDRHGFDHLGAVVQCIFCYERASLYKMGEGARARHARKHSGEARAAAETARREQDLIDLATTHEAGLDPAGGTQ